MQQVTGALQAEQVRLAELVTPVDRDELALPSACDGWSIADVLLHLAQTNELAVASVRGELTTAVHAGAGLGAAKDVDEWAAMAVASERSDDLSEARTRWLASAQEVLEVFAACDPHARVQWVAGDLAARTLATTRLSETWIHAGDIAAGLGTHLEPTKRLWHIARLAHRTLHYAFAAAHEEIAGAIAFDLRSPGGERWLFGDEHSPTVVSGPATELCAVAAQRMSAADSTLGARGPDAESALQLVRTFA